MECENCGSTRGVIVRHNRIHGRDIELCTVCTDTYTGHYERYPTNAEDIRIVLKAIAQCTNIVLEAIEAERRARGAS